MSMYDPGQRVRSERTGVPIEAVEVRESVAASSLDDTLSDQARFGENRRWISDLKAFDLDRPDSSLTRGGEYIPREIDDFTEKRRRVVAAIGAG